MTLFHERITPEGRARALYYFFGWQGGTIHQLAQATGCKADQLLTGPLHIPGGGLNSDHGGFSAVRTCDTAWRVNQLAPKRQGDWAYWAGVICGFWATGPLDVRTAEA